MAVEPGFDVFVSYAHADNGVPVGAEVAHGWVTALATNLNEGPNVLRKRLFIDHQLRPGDAFSDDLLAKVEHSSLLVLLLSQNYVDSDWCGKELDHFIRTHAADAERPGEVYVVELFPYERLADVPPRIQSLRKRLIHAKFWYQQPGAAEPSLAGYPSAKECGPEGRDHYWKVLNELRAALDSRLRVLRSQRPTAVELRSEPPPTQTLPSPPRPILGTVLLADTTDDLEAQRNTVKAALEPEGALVLPDGDYVELTPQEFEAAVAGDLARADLFVQLLSPAAGRKGNFEAPKPQLQYQRALAANVPILQWCERLPATGEVTDPGHARLFETETLRVTHLADFKTGVIERLRADRAQRDRAAAAAENEAGRSTLPSAKRQIFIDDVAGERLLSDRVRAIIRGLGYGLRSLPPGAPLGNNGIDVKELLRPCRAGITIYTDRTKYAVAYNRLVFFINQIADGNVPISRWGVFLQHGTVASEFGIESDDVVPVTEQGLADFLLAL